MQSECSKNIGPTSPTSATSARFRQGELWPISSPAGSHVSHFLMPGSETARAITVSSGRRCLMLSRVSGPLGSLVKMCLGSFRWRSTKCYLTWKAQTTPQGRLLFQLAPRAPRTNEPEPGLWPTPRAEKVGGYSSPGYRPTLQQIVKERDPMAPQSWKLNPRWVSQLMGLPPDWTSLDPVSDNTSGRSQD